MSEITAVAKTVNELLGGIKYTIGFFQREYKWGEKQVTELIEDLSNRFLMDFEPEHAREQVESYGHYFLGSIIISQDRAKKSVIDGQQRLTTLTLLMIHLSSLKREHPEAASITPIDRLIYSARHGKRSFNLDVKEREACMEALFEQRPFDPNSQSDESVQNIVLRYKDMTERLPDEITGQALPYFVDWLLDNVDLVEITAHSDEDAYAIFETMNDRGLSLSPADMLKGYLLANITDTVRRDLANKLWRDRIHEMNQVGKDVAADSFKAWLRSQYAKTIRERRRGAQPEDFDRLGTEFHRWVRDKSKEVIGLRASADFLRFIERDFHFYTLQYKRLIEASSSPQQGLEHVLYNAHHGFTLQYMLLLAPLRPEDSPNIITLKMRLVAMFVDILLTWRLWNWRSIAYSTMQYAMFLVMRDIRGLDPQPLAAKLHETLLRQEETFATNDRLSVHQQNRYYLHRILARMIDYMEKQSDGAGRYPEYVSTTISDRYEVEHIWADKPERHTDEFDHPHDFRDYRNRIGGLLLLPRSFNASYGAKPYESKLPLYIEHNLLARSLHPQCYDKHHTRYNRFVAQSGLPFRPHTEFKTADLDARQALLAQLAAQIWNPDNLLAEVAL